MHTHARRPETAALVGKGFCSDVYAWGEGRVLKLFHGGGGRERAGREYAATRAVHAAELPAPAAYGLVEVEDRFGVVLERMNGVSLLEYTQARPWALFGAIRQFAELHARIHRCTAPAGLPSLRERITARIEASDAPAADRQAARDRLAALPDGTALCHGDFHPGNVLVTRRGPVVIDWGSASCGDPIGDVAWTSRLMRTADLPPWSRRYMHLLLKCLRPVMHRSYLARCLRVYAGTRRQVEAWQTPIAAAARNWRLPTTTCRAATRDAAGGRSRHRRLTRVRGNSSAASFSSPSRARSIFHAAACAAPHQRPTRGHREARRSAAPASPWADVGDPSYGPARKMGRGSRPPSLWSPR